MFKKIFINILIVVFLFSSSNAFPQFLGFEDETNIEVFLIVGGVQVLDIFFPQRVSVRNPEIIDVDVSSNEEIIFVAKQAGTTAVTVWDREGEKVFFVTVYEHDPDVLKKRLNKLIGSKLGIKGVDFKKNSMSGKLIAVGKVTAGEKVQLDKVLEPFVESVDNLVIVKEESKMVEIECHILELTKSFSNVLGFDWSGSSGSSPTAVTTLTEVLTPAATSGGNIRDVFEVVDWTRSAFDVQLMAATTTGKGKILAQPKLLCLSGQEANFLVGGEIPIVQVTSTAAGDTVSESVEYKEYGVRLDILPIVLEGNNIKLNLTTEVKELSSEGQYVRADGTIIKAFATRNASTVLNLKEGQGVIISGLLKDKVTKDDISQVPGLGDIPILGALFRSKDYQDEQTELVISLVPKIISSEKKKVDSLETPIKSTKVPDRFAIYPSYLQKEEALEGYILRVQKMIFGALDYPKLAEEAGWQGMVKLKLHLDSKGRIMDVVITESSGYIAFDNNVLKIAKSLSPYPPFPLGVKIKDLWIDVPIIYEMN